MRGLFNIPRGKYFWSWPPFVVFLALASVLLAMSAARLARRYGEARREKQALEKKVEELKAEVLRAEEAVSAAGSSEVIEKMAKEKLNLKKPEEQVVVVRPPKEIALSRQQPAASENVLNIFLFRWLSGWFNFFKR